MGAEEIKEQILKLIIKNSPNPTTSKEIVDTLKIAYSTISKYLLVLEAEKKIKTNDYGNIKFYYSNDKEKK